MVLTINAIDRCDSSNEMYHHLQPKKVAINRTEKDILLLRTLLTRRSTIFLKAGVSYG